MRQQPGVVEAVVFFAGGRIVRQMHLTEFEALLDGVVHLHAHAAERVRAVFLIIDPRLRILAAVFFHIEFDGTGAADPRWNLPLRRLAEGGAPGPDLGAGPIRLVCAGVADQGFTPHLWRPGDWSASGELAQLRDAVTGNALGILLDEAVFDAPVDRSRVAEPTATAQLEQLQLALQMRNREVQQLQVELRARDEAFRLRREELSAQLRAIEQQVGEETQAQRAALEAEMAERLEREYAELRENLAAREMELVYRDELDTQMQAELQQLERRCEGAAQEAVALFLQRLERAGVHLSVNQADGGERVLAGSEVLDYLAAREASDA